MHTENQLRPGRARVALLLGIVGMISAPAPAASIAVVLAPGRTLAQVRQDAPRRSSNLAFRTKVHLIKFGLLAVVLAGAGIAHLLRRPAAPKND